MAIVRQLVVIGVNDYKYPPWQILKNAVVDSDRISAVLTGKYGFTEEERLIDAQATRQSIISKLHAICKNHIKGDSLIVYFAGHGIQDPDSGKGFWIPQDATGDKSTWINNETMLEVLQGSRASHILLISDSCFSGTLNPVPTPVAHYDYDQLEALSSRWILTAGRIEPVSDGNAGEGSPFNRLLCGYLEGANQEAISAEEIFLQIRNEVYAQFSQQPTFGSFDLAQHRAGQLILRVDDGRGGTGAGRILYPKFPLPETPGLKSYIPRKISPYTSSRLTLPGSEWESEGILLLDLIARENKIMLLGGAGSGKSIELVEMA